MNHFCFLFRLSSSLGLATFFISHSIFASVSTATHYDLRAALQYAITHSPQFDTLKRQLNMTELEQQTAYARFFPSVDLLSTHGLEDSSPSLKNTPWKSELSLALTESLYDNGVTYNQWQQAKLAHQEAQLNFQNQKNQVSLELALAFLQYSLQLQLLDIQEKQSMLMDKQFAMIAEDYHQGIKTKNDYLRFKTQVGRNEIDRVNGKSRVEKARAELQRLMGTPLIEHTQISFTPIPLGGMGIQTRELTPNFQIENHLQFQIHTLQQERQVLAGNLARRKRFPEWSVSTGVNYGSTDYVGTRRLFFDEDRLGWNALLTVKFNLFDWGIRAREEELTLQKIQVQQNQSESGLMILRSSLQQLQLDLKLAQQNTALCRELLAMEKENLNFIEREYRNGKIPFLDLVTGLNNLTDAQIKLYSASSELQTVQMTLLAHQGKLYDFLLQ